MATTLRCPQAVAPLPWRARRPNNSRGTIPMGPRQVSNIRAFGRSDIGSFARDAWRSANDGFERFLFEAKKTAERLDRRYALSHRFDTIAQSAAARAREIDRDLEIGTRWRAFSMDFSRNLPRVCSIAFTILLYYVYGYDVVLCLLSSCLVGVCNLCSTGSSLMISWKPHWEEVLR